MKQKLNISQIQYAKRTWNNGNEPALNATNLNSIEEGIRSAVDAINQIRILLNGGETPYPDIENSISVQMQTVNEIQQGLNSHKHLSVTTTSSGFMTSELLKKLNTAVEDIVNIKDSLTELKDSLTELLVDSDTVKDSKTLDGKSLEYFASKEDIEKIQTSLGGSINWNEYS